MLIRMCVRCKKVIEYPHKYCGKCELIVERQKEITKQKRNSLYNRSRDQKYMKLYNSKVWRLLSKKYLSDHKLCEKCLQIMQINKEYIPLLSEECHHKIPIQTAEGWKRRLDYNNLEALCHDHHDLKHDRFKNRAKLSKNTI